MEPTPENMWYWIGVKLSPNKGVAITPVQRRTPDRMSWFCHCESILVPNTTPGSTPAELHLAVEGANPTEAWEKFCTALIKFAREKYIAVLSGPKSRPFRRHWKWSDDLGYFKEVQLAPA